MTTTDKQGDSENYLYERLDDEALLDLMLQPYCDLLEGRQLRLTMRGQRMVRNEVLRRMDPDRADQPF